MTMHYIKIRPSFYAPLKKTFMCFFKRVGYVATPIANNVHTTDVEIS